MPYSDNYIPTISHLMYAVDNQGQQLRPQPPVSPDIFNPNGLDFYNLNPSLDLKPVSMLSGDQLYEIDKPLAYGMVALLRLSTKSLRRAIDANYMPSPDDTLAPVHISSDFLDHIMMPEPPWIDEQELSESTARVLRAGTVSDCLEVWKSCCFKALKAKVWRAQFVWEKETSMDANGGEKFITLPTPNPYEDSTSAISQYPPPPSNSLAAESNTAEYDPATLDVTIPNIPVSFEADEPSSGKPTTVPTPSREFCVPHKDDVPPPAGSWAPSVVSYNSGSWPGLGSPAWHESKKRVTKWLGEQGYKKTPRWERRCSPSHSFIGCPVVHTNLPVVADCEPGFEFVARKSTLPSVWLAKRPATCRADRQNLQRLPTIDAMHRSAEKNTGRSAQWLFQTDKMDRINNGEMAPEELARRAARRWKVMQEKLTEQGY